MSDADAQDAVKRECGACGAEPDEECRPLCIGEAAHLDTYPKRAADGRGLVWACCESSIGPVCGHRRNPHGYSGPRTRWIEGDRLTALIDTIRQDFNWPGGMDTFLSDPGGWMAAKGYDADHQTAAAAIDALTATAGTP